MCPRAKSLLRAAARFRNFARFIGFSIARNEYTYIFHLTDRRTLIYSLFDGKLDFGELMSI